MLSIFISTLAATSSPFVADGVIVPTFADTDGRLQILHGGGCVSIQNRSLCYTSSKEAILSNSKLGHRLIEVDIVMSRDNQVLLAHDGLESSYRLDKKFHEITGEEFLRHRFQGRGSDNEGLTPLLFTDLLLLMKTEPSLKNALFVLDIKGDSKGYKRVIQNIIKLLDDNPVLYSRIVPQVYAEDDIIAADSKPFASLFLAVWKFGLQDETILDLTQRYNIGVVTMWHNRQTKNNAIIGPPPALVHDLLERGVIPVIHGKTSYTNIPEGVGCFTYHAKHNCIQKSISQ